MFKFCLLVFAALALGPRDVNGLLGGINVRDGSFLYHAIVVQGDTNLCSGALISNKHVLSSATCVEMSKTFSNCVTILVGSVNVNNDNRNVKIEILKRLSYEDFDPANWMHDIGIFTLKSESPYNTATLPEGNHALVGWSADVSAAGSSVFGGPNSSVLQKLPVQIMDNKKCQKRFPVRKIHNTYICGLPPTGSGICSGDSGAPLAQHNVIIGIAIGITPPCGSHPDVYINVALYKDWIIRKIA